MSSSASGARPSNSGKSEISDWSSMSVTPYPGSFDQRAGARILADITLVKSTVGLAFGRPAVLLQDRRSMGHRFCGFRGVVILVDVRIVRAADFQDTGKPTLDTAERMIDQHELARHLQLDVHDRRAPGRHRCGLYVSHGRGRQRPEIVYALEDLTDNVEG